MARGRPKSDLTASEIQKRSDEKRGVKSKSFKLHNNTIALIEQAAKARNMPQAQLIKLAVEQFVSGNGG